MSVPTSLSELLVRARQGDARAKDDLLGMYRPYLKLWAEQSIGLRMQRRFDASDIAQNTLTLAARDLDDFQGSSESEFSGWITQILRHQLSNFVRDHRASMRDVSKERPLELPADTATLTWFEPAGDSTSPSEKAVQGERSLRLAAVLSELPSDQAEAVRLRHLEGRSLDEIAEHLQRSAGAVAGLIKRGLQALREKMTSESWM